MKRERLGLFGGTFDPPHAGHLILAEVAARQFHLTRVLWTPAPMPPHKTGQVVAPLAHRLEMLKRAIADHPLFEICDIEIRRPGPHYTADTVRALAEQNPQAEIILLLGEDSLRDFPAWREPRVILQFVSRVGAMRRLREPLELDPIFARLPELKEKLVFLHAPPQDLSSRELRERIARGEPCEEDLPPAVRTYIEENGLYRE